MKLFLEFWLECGLVQPCVAAHPGIFSGMLSSDGQRNLTGKSKLARFRGVLLSFLMQCALGSTRSDR